MGQGWLKFPLVAGPSARAAVSKSLDKPAFPTPRTGRQLDAARPAWRRPVGDRPRLVPQPLLAPACQHRLGGCRECSQAFAAPAKNCGARYLKGRAGQEDLRFVDPTARLR